MQFAADRLEAPTAIRTDLGAIFISLELSRSSWVVTSLSPGGGEKMSKHTVRGGDVAGLLKRFAQLREKAKGRTGKVFPLIVIQEAGLDGFWIDRVVQNEGIESHVVDPASIATSRRRRRAKTDGIDGEALVRALLAVEQTTAPVPPAMLLGVKGIGPEFAAVLWSEGLSRPFENRRQIAAYAGLAPTPWQSGSVDREQGISQSGNPRLRTTMVHTPTRPACPSRASG